MIAMLALFGNHVKHGLFQAHFAELWNGFAAVLPAAEWQAGMEPLILGTRSSSTKGRLSAAYGQAFDAEPVARSYPGQNSEAAVRVRLDLPFSAIDLAHSFGDQQCALERAQPYAGLGQHFGEPWINVLFRALTGHRDLFVKSRP